MRSGSCIESLRLRVDDHHIHYLTAGSGPPVVLMHGGASDSQDWAETMDALSHSYTLYAPDMVGYGKSDRHRGSYYLSDFVKFTHGLVQKLGLTSFSLVGHSLGGRVCLEIALRHPELVSTLVLVDSVGFVKLAWWGTLLGSAAWGLRRVLGREQPYPGFLKEEGEDKHWRCVDRLSTLRMPTLVAWNRRDPYYPMAGALKAARLIPQVQLEVFPGYGHAPHKQERDQFNNLLLGFLRRG
ncbi:MAG: alpha/beta hydrolase [Dehalococcoidia bacterium]